MAHSHPVMLVFCQLLIDRNKDVGLEKSLPQVHSLRRSASREEGNSEGMSYLFVCCFVLCLKNYKEHPIMLKMDKAVHSKVDFQKSENIKGLNQATLMASTVARKWSAKI